MHPGCNRPRKDGASDTREKCVIVTDGPFTEAKELIAGYTIIQVRSRDEALPWTKRFPNPMGENAQAEIEVRQLYEPEDFGPGTEVERFLGLEAQRSKPGRRSRRRTSLQRLRFEYIGIGTVTFQMRKSLFIKRV